MHDLVLSNKTTISPSHSSDRKSLMRSVLQVHDRLAVAVCPCEHAASRLSISPTKAHFVDGVQGQSAENLLVAETQLEPYGLKRIYGFCMDLMSSLAFKQGKVLVVCSGSCDQDITHSALLVGALMILNFDFQVDQVTQAFAPIADRFTPYADDLTLESCWSALHHVQSQCSWLCLDTKYSKAFQRPSSLEYDPATIDMDEYAHYDSPINGNFHMLIPDQLLLFNRPTDLPDGAPWADAGGERRFGPAFYADVFSELGVAVVVRCCGAGGYDATPFAERGIEVEDLQLDPAGSPTLAAVDRFLSLMRHAPGAVAFHGDATGRLGAAGALLATVLIRAHRFPAAAAVAWIRMVHPAAVPAAHHGFLREYEALVRSEAGAAGAAASVQLARSASTPRVLDVGALGAALRPEPCVEWGRGLQSFWQGRAHSA